LCHKSERTVDIEQSNRTEREDIQNATKLAPLGKAQQTTAV